MPDIQAKEVAIKSTDELLHAVVNLDNESLQYLYKKVQDTMIERRSQKTEENRLVAAIKSVIPPSAVRRYKDLYKKFEIQTIAQKELEELQLITDFIEEKSAERVALLNQLATIKNMSLAELRKTIRISEIYG